jgi:hypothetical protein
MTNIRDVLNARQSTHGDYTDHARVTQNIKAMMHDSPNWSRLHADQIETLDMLAHKIGRILSGEPDFADHWDDMAGYATLSADRVRQRLSNVGQYSLPLTEPVLDSIVRQPRGDVDFEKVLREIEEGDAE